MNYNTEKLQCKYGHWFDLDNTKVDPKTGKRACRICKARRTTEWRKRKESNVK